MSNTKIEIYGSVPLRIGGKELLSLTGSAIILEIGGNRILVDLGLFQGGEGADLFNKKNTEFLKDIDAVIISHPHIDHVGRLPLLFKHGFRKPIYMTSAAKDITRLMLEDCFKIQEGDRIERIRRNDKLGFRLKQALKVKQSLIALKKNKFSDKAEKDSTKSFIQKKLGKDFKENEVMKKLSDYLGFYKVETEQDIKRVMKDLKEALFTEEDMQGVLSLIKPLEYGDEQIVSNKLMSSKNRNSENQDVLENLPEIIAKYNKSQNPKEIEKRQSKRVSMENLSSDLDKKIKPYYYDQENKRYNKNGKFFDRLNLKSGTIDDREPIQEEKQYSDLNEYLGDLFKGDVSVDLKSEKRKLREIWQKKLEDEIEQVVESNPNLITKTEELKKKLEAAFSFCFSHSYIYDKEGKLKKPYKDQSFYRGVRKQYKKNKDLLKKYGIENRGDIYRFRAKNSQIVDAFKINIPFNNMDIDAASRALKIESKSKGLRKVTGFTLTDAAHVVGSASINIVAGETRGRVNSLIDINGNATSVCLSGDLGRIENNRMGKPEIPAFPVDYLQVESTYGGKEHRNRDESVQDLINSISESKGNTLISSFAQHRLQEILMTLLEEKLKNKDLFGNREIVIDAPLGEKLTNLYVNYMGEVFDLLNPAVQKELFGKQVFRFLGQDEWKEIHGQVSFDSLSDQDLEAIKGLEKEEAEEYIKKKNQENLEKKYIILASSGMMEGGAIMNHLSEMLEDPDVTILSPGYLCEGTIGHQIVIEGRKHVTIAGEKFEVKCNKKFIDGFSSHISHSETLGYLKECIEEGKFKLDSTISLNHGNIEGQMILKKDIESLLKQFDRTDIKVVIPDIFDSYSIERRRVTKRSKDVEKFTVLNGDPKGLVPSFLLGDIDLDKGESSKDNLEKKQIEEQRDINYKIISKYKERCSIVLGKIRKTKENLSRKFLHNSLKPHFGKLFFTSLGKVSRLGTWQKVVFDGIVDKKIKINKGLKDSMSSNKNKIKNIDIIYDLIEEFKNNIDFNYPEQCVDMDNEILELRENISQLLDEKEAYQVEYNEFIEKDRKHRILKQEIENRKNAILRLEKQKSEIEEKAISEAEIVDSMASKYFIDAQIEIIEEELLVYEKELINMPEFEIIEFDRIEGYRKQINAKKRRITYLTVKIKDLNLQISGDTSDLKNRIEKINHNIYIIDENLKSIKEKSKDKKISKRDREKISKLNTQKLAKKKKIRDLEKKIEKIEYKRPNFEERLKRNLPENFYKEIEKAFRKIWNNEGDEGLVILRDLLDNVILDLKSDIAVKLGDLKPHLSIKLRPREPHFGGRNLYEELTIGENSNILDTDLLKGLLEENVLSESDKKYINKQLSEIENVGRVSLKTLTKKTRKYLNQIEYDEDNEKNQSIKLRLEKQLFDKQTGKLDVEKLTELVESDFFSGKEKKYLILQLEEINKSIYNRKTGKRELAAPMKKLSKYLKSKQTYNNDLGKSLDISIKELNKEALQILEDIFEKEYFDENIYPNFNIYLYLASKEKFADYIDKKYNLEKLKGFDESFETIESSQEEIEYVQDDFDNISDSNIVATSKEALKDLNYGISILVQDTKEKINKINEML